MGIDITAVSSLKHSELWEAAKKLGGQAALAKHLGLQPGAIGDYCALKRCPPVHRWSDERRADVERKLFDLTGKTLDELFPQSLRESAEFLNAPKRFESRRTFEAAALLTYAAA